VVEEQPEILFCTACTVENSEEPEAESVVAEHTCFSCKEPLCESHSYREENGSKKVCDDCSKKVISRWGWGGSPGQGGVTSWFPFIHTYCQEHGQNRFDLPKPAKRNFIGYDGSSPEW